MAHRVEGQKHGTGVVVGARGSQGRWTEAYGRTRVGGPATDPRSIFPAASLTKIFTALLLADSARRGLLSIDDPLSRHLPATVTVPAFDGRSITLADLASHGSGLPLRPPNLASKNPEDPYAGYRTPHLYAAISAFRLDRAPGSKFEYSNFAFGLLGHAIEHRTGRSFGELVRDKIVVPLDLRDTGLAPPKLDDRRRVQGYDIDLKPVPPWDLAALVEAGGLFSTVDDLLKFLGVWLGERETPLSAAGRDMLRLSRPGASPEVRMALGWRVERSGDRTLVWSNGSAGGTRSFMGFCPQTRAGVVAMNNAQTGLGVDDIARHVLQPSEKMDMSTPPVRHEIAFAAEMARFVGLYRYAPGDEFVIAPEGAGLVLKQGPQGLRLRPLGPNAFYVKEVEADVAFVEDTSGRPEALMLTQGGETWRYGRVDDGAEKP
jgi:CubicO group peptidase (beta-lactamase class C family)